MSLIEERKRRHSVNDSDDDDLRSPKSASPSMDDDRRAHHNELERRRRDHIKDHFTALKDTIPLLDGEKSSRALILKRAVEYISVMQSRLNEHQRSIDELRRKNELLEEKLKDKRPEPTSSCAVPTFSTQRVPISPIMLPTLKPNLAQFAPTVPTMDSNTASILSALEPSQLNTLLQSSQDSIVTLTQALLATKVASTNVPVYQHVPTNNIILSDNQLIRY